MKTTFKMSVLALSLGLMTIVSSCGEKKEVSSDVDTTKSTTVETTVDTTAATVDTTTSATTTTEMKKEETVK
jgi:hypothetical protein